MKIRTTIRALHPRTVFRISRAERAEVRNVFVEIEQDGVIGHGEASPNAFYGETAEEVNAKLESAATELRQRRVADVKDIAKLWPLLEPSRAAQCALDVALWDLVAKLAGCSVAELALGVRPRSVATFCTLGISNRDELATKLEELADFPLIKIKMEARADLSTVRFVRERSAARLAVDANCAWSGCDVPALSHELAALGVEFIEQPLPPAEDARMPQVLAASALPVIADESCVVREDVERMPGAFSGFNIKLVKCGGITPALAMLRRGLELGLRTMVGCMLESSALIAAGAVIAQGTDYADLDGAWLIRDDPFDGWRFENGVLHPAEGGGLGITARARE